MVASRDVLLIEDHRDIAEMIYDYLESEGYAVDYADSGDAGLNFGSENHYDAIVLDVMLPGIDGYEVCRRLREESRVEAPVLMLTARDTLEDKLSGFESGADDYLVKPFDLEELGARLKALLRRQRRVDDDSLSVGDLTIDLKTHKVTRAGKTLTLTPIGKKILITLMQASPGVVDRKAIERSVWGDVPPDSDALRSHLYNLRKVVDRPFETALIHTVQGAGFRIADEP